MEDEGVVVYMAEVWFVDLPLSRSWLWLWWLWWWRGVWEVDGRVDEIGEG